VRYFSPLGFFGGIGVSFVHQDVSRQEGAPFAQGENSFVVVDASVGYRLPQRRGLVSFEARNLLNEGFKFQDDNYRVAQDQPNFSPFIPERSILGRLTINF
jgi:outer membrane receptor protein involved in Fe transport